MVYLALEAEKGDVLNVSHSFDCRSLYMVGPVLFVFAPSSVSYVQTLGLNCGPAV